jgi:hypothetical protein
VGLDNVILESVPEKLGLDNVTPVSVPILPPAVIAVDPIVARVPVNAAVPTEVAGKVIVPAVTVKPPFVVNNLFTTALPVIPTFPPTATVFPVEVAPPPAMSVCPDATVKPAFAVINPELVNAVALIVPFTSNADWGLVRPMPTFPLPSIVITVVSGEPVCALARAISNLVAAFAFPDGYLDKLKFTAEWYEFVNVPARCNWSIGVGSFTID